MAEKEPALHLYSLATPNGQKVGIALEELGVPYKATTVDIRKNVQFEDWFVKINPNSKIPALIDNEGPDGKPISIFESAAILIYLGEKFGKLYPNDPRKRYEVLEWVFWQMSGVGPISGQVNHFYNAAPEDVPYAKKRYLTEQKRLLEVLDKRLEHHEYVAADEYTIADICLFPWIRSVLNNEAKVGGHAPLPHIRRWVKQVEQRPAVQKGLTVTPFA